MSCTYIYNNRYYTESEILNAIKKGNVKLGDVALARQNLKNILDLSEDELEIVHGLMDNDAVGKLEKDGRIILSDAFVQGDEYHEAFHRVFQMLISEDQRQYMIAEYKSRRNIQSAIYNKQKEYNGISEDAAIEELLAEEFMMYQLNDGNYTVPPAVESVFQKILNFIKKILGLRNIEEIYELIRKGEFAKAEIKQYPKTAKESRITEPLYRQLGLNSDIEVTEIVESVVLNAVKSIYGDIPRLTYDSKTKKAIQKKSIDSSALLSSDFTQALTTGFVHTMMELARSTDKNKQRIARIIEDDAVSFFQEGDIIKPLIKGESKLYDLLQKRLSQFNISSKQDVLKYKSLEEDAPVEEGDEIQEGEASNDFAFMKSSIEYDPKSDVTLAVKLLINSLSSEKKSKNLELSQLSNYDEVSAILFKTLADTPATWEAVSEKLQSIEDKYTWVSELIEKLDPEKHKDTQLSLNNGDRNFRISLRSQFIRTFVKASYDMYTFNWEKGDLRLYNNRDLTDVRAIVNSMKDHIIATFRNKDEIIDILEDREFSLTDVFKNVFGYDIDEKLIEDSVDGVLMNARIKNIIQTTIDALNNEDITMLDIFKKNLEGYNSKGNLVELDIYDNLNKIVSHVSSKGTPKEVMIFNHDGKRVYPYSMHTYQTRVASYINYVVDKYPILNGNKKEAIENRIALLQSLAPQLFTPFNFDSNGNPTSIMLKKILESNNKYRIGITLGVKSSTAVDAKLLTEADLVTIMLRGIHPYANKTELFTSLKHGDRGLLFTGSYEDGSTYFDTVDSDVLDREFVFYLSKILVDEVRFIKENDYKDVKTLSDVKTIKLFSDLNLTNEEINQIYRSKKTTEAQNKKLLQIANKLIASFKDLMVEHNLMLDHRNSMLDDKGNPVWLSSEFKNDNHDELIKYAVYNHAIHYIEEARVLSGTISQYKNIADFFKRVQSLSSSGNNLDTSGELNAYIDLQFNKPFTIIKYDGSVVQLDRYSDTETISNSKIKEEVLTGPVVMSRNIEGLQNIFRQGLEYEAQFTDKLTPEVIDNLVDEWTSAYSKYEEADGATYINIFMYKQYKIRQGKWNYKDENAFQIELAVLGSNSSLEDLKLYVEGVDLPNGSRIYRLYAYNETNKRLPEIRVFDTNAFKDLKDHINPFTMEKPIYTGPVEIEYTENNQKAKNNAVLGIRKTSFHVLVPSLIRKSKKLSEMNEDMLINGIDMKPLDSASKLGVSKKINDFYEDAVVDRNVNTLDFKYLSEQLPVSPKSKEEIKNATQSVKIMMMDMMNEGYPKDITEDKKSEFDNASEEQKEAMSEVFRVINRYKKALSDLITLKKADLLSELDVLIYDIKEDVSYYDKQDSITINNIEKIKQILLNQSDNLHVVEAIQKLSSDNKKIDLLPSYRKLESILFSIISNNIIVHKRPGDMKPQFAISGFESGVETAEGKVLSSNKLKFYRIEDNVIKPAEVMMPLDLDRLPNFIKYVNNKSKAKIKNVAQAINIYNNFNEEDKLFVKGLRIPNQQTSFNGIYTVKEFMLPTVQSMIILPSESVPQSSTDFDIDKQQIYYQVIDRKGNIAGLREDGTFDTNSHGGVYNQLLYAEVDLLLNKSNIHHLLAPVNEGFLSNDLFKKQMLKHKEYSEAYIDSNRSEMTIPIKANDFLNPAKHIETSIAMSQSKVNVGKVATSQTLHAVAQHDGLEFNDFYTDLVTGDQYSSKLPIEGGDSLKFGSIYSEDGRYISEVVSTVLTSLLDGIKDNYGVMLNIANTTIPTVTLLIRKGIPIETVLDLIMQPSVIQYVVESNFRNSIVAHARGKRGKADSVIENTVRKYNRKGNKQKISTDDIKMFRKKMRDGDFKNSFLTRADLTSKAVNQNKVLAAFIRAEELANTLLSYTLYSTPDTKVVRSMSQLESIATVQQELNSIKLFKQNVESGFFNDFYSARDYYAKLLPQFYSMRNKKNGDLLYRSVLPNFTSRLMKSSAQERFSRIAESQVVSSMLIEDLDKKIYGFDKLFKGNNSFINELRRLKINPDYNGNYFLENLIVVSEEVVDPLNPDTFVGAVRLDNRAASAYHYYLAYNAFKQLPTDVKNKLFVVNLYQGGLDYTRWSLDEVIDVDTKMNFLESLKDKEITNKYLVNLQTRLVQWNPEVLSYRKPYKNMYSGLSLTTTSDGRSVITNGSESVLAAANSVIKRFDATGQLFKTLSKESLSPIYTQSSVNESGRKNINYKGVKKVISGGQTGIDRLGLEVASSLNIQTGGVAPKGYRTEIGLDISLKNFGLTEDSSSDYDSRTEQNVINSDATVLFGNMKSAGSKLTISLLQQNSKPYIINPTVKELQNFLSENNVETLNVAGNRKSKLTEDQIKNYKNVLTKALSKQSTEAPDELTNQCKQQ